jgi:2-oxoglutarate dehydrogenase E1 component
LIHGDASIAGQGVVYESLQLMRLAGYSTGGTIHIVVNNQVGFTTPPSQGRSTRYCTDIAKTFGCPVFHVNAEDPEGCLFAVKLAVEIRLKFQCDAFIDLNGYRKYGHNEGDEPVFMQPREYQLIRAKKTIREIYAAGVEADASFKETLTTHFERAKGEAPHGAEERYGSGWKEFVQPPASLLFQPFETKISVKIATDVIENYCRIPQGFHLNAKLIKWVEDRREMLKSDKIDWSTAECLGFGSLLAAKTPVRLCGQDSQRGTFSQRHAVWIDQENGQSYKPFSSLEVYNSPLSEFACLAFEYGYSWMTLNGLNLWEAQYGDFTIGAETVIDHYLTTAEQKWARYSSLTLLLPHGYEGQGPEHSSGRIERFLQLSAKENIQVVNPTTPAQYFHLLRRQALRPIKKPLVVFTPKSLLRLPACVSSLKAITEGAFEEVLNDPAPPKNPRRLLLCSGKIYYELAAKKPSDIALVRLEQLYPVHRQKLEETLRGYASCKEIYWVQEEPQNMGAWEFIQPYIQELLPKQMSLHYVGRERSAVTATGSFRQHAQELERIFKEAFA